MRNGLATSGDAEVTLIDPIPSDYSVGAVLSESVMVQPLHAPWRRKRDSSVSRFEVRRLARPSTGDQQGGVLPSKATLEEARVFLKRYAKEVNSCVELSQTSKSMYIDFAACFVKWMCGRFQPGIRGLNSRTLWRLRGRTL